MVDMPADDDDQVARMQAAWRYRGHQRPAFAETPGPDQESVWDYPRPPALAASNRRVVVALGGQIIADSCRAWRLLETASPPTFYLPPDDVDAAALQAARGSSFCEWKGPAHYWDVIAGARRADSAAWSYPEAGGAYANIAGYFSFYPGRLDCTVDGQAVSAQPGAFYGGWVTDDVVGPFKGLPGTGDW